MVGKKINKLKKIKKKYWTKRNRKMGGRSFNITNGAFGGTLATVNSRSHRPSPANSPLPTVGWSKIVCLSNLKWRTTRCKNGPPFFWLCPHRPILGISSLTRDLHKGGDIQHSTFNIRTDIATTILTQPRGPIQWKSYKVSKIQVSRGWVRAIEDKWNYDVVLNGWLQWVSSFLQTISVG